MQDFVLIYCSYYDSYYLRNRSMNTGKYITNVSGLQYFQLFRFGTILIISILFAKSHLLTEEIGRYEVLLLIAGAVCYFWVSGLIQSLLSLYNNNRSFSGNPVKSDDRSPVLFNAFLLMIFFTGLATLFVFVFSSFLATTLGGRSEIPCFDLLILYLLFSTPSNLIEYIYLLRNRPRHIIVYGTVTFLLQIVLVGGPVVAGYGIEYGIAGLVVISGLRFVWLSVLIFRHARFQFSRLFIREHISLAAPLIISIFLSGSAQFVDGFLVAYKFGEARLAVFRYGAREMPVVVLMANAFSTAMLPEFSPAGGIREAIATLRRKSLRLMHLLFPLTIILLLLSHRLYPIVFNNNFIDSARVFNLYLLIIVSRLVFPQT
ncbi:MAG: oligosaccharide flippase family protein, partial [Bacteroidetes bacterium]|nr:oligosaccharide flippase family protein [Bacteroidota bacterium]